MDIQDIKVIRNEVSYSMMTKLVEIAVNNSYSAVTHEYHKYLRDFGETFALLVGFTNYAFNEDGSMEQDDDLSGKLFEAVMQIAHSDKWNSEIIPNLGKTYAEFTGYVEQEIAYKNRPLANFDKLVQTATAVLEKAIKIMDAIDVDALANVDTEKFGAIIDKIISANDNLEKAKALEKA